MIIDTELERLFVPQHGLGTMQVSHAGFDIARLTGSYVMLIPPTWLLKSPASSRMLVPTPIVIFEQPRRVSASLAKIFVWTKL
jgi:hypothetical protein